jgi:hypothetical protein
VSQLDGGGKGEDPIQVTSFLSSLFSFFFTLHVSLFDVIYNPLLASNSVFKSLVITHTLKQTRITHIFSCSAMPNESFVGQHTHLLDHKRWGSHHTPHG